MSLPGGGCADCSSVPSPPPLAAPAGGFSSAAMQSSQNQFGFSQSAAVRGPARDVSEALFSLDRVLQGESAETRMGAPLCGPRGSASA